MIPSQYLIPVRLVVMIFPYISIHFFISIYYFLIDIGDFAPILKLMLGKPIKQGLAAKDIERLLDKQTAVILGAVDKQYSQIRRKSYQSDSQRKIRG